MNGLAQSVIAQLAAQGVTAVRLCADSRRIRPGDVFVAMPGKRSDGGDYAADAVARGAVAVLHQGALSALAVPTVAVADIAGLAGEIAHLAFGRPSEKLSLAGVTGTNGKTSVSLWIAQTMSAFGHKCAFVGTLGTGFPGQLDPGVNTTPDAVSLQATLAHFVDEKAVACAMEVSSIGIEEGRVNGVHFDVAVFTNLTQDHLDYHGSMSAYGAAKRRLFSWPGLRAAVINLDDAFGADLARSLSGQVKVIGYTLNGQSGGDLTLAARDLIMGDKGLAFKVDGTDLVAPVVGRFNASNLLAVIGTLLTADKSLAEIAAVLCHIVPPPGRMQTLGGGDQPLVVIDYAHTPDALEKALGALRETVKARGGKLICVFGCGGDRDRGKRPQMGAVAERLAERVIVSSDNPRHEDPPAIIADILAGMNLKPQVEADRATAISMALGSADQRDVVLLAGKGHETYQEVAGERLPFSDLEQARAALERRS